MKNNPDIIAFPGQGANDPEIEEMLTAGGRKKLTNLPQDERFNIRVVEIIQTLEDEGRQPDEHELAVLTRAEIAYKQIAENDPDRIHSVTANEQLGRVRVALRGTLKADAGLRRAA